MDLSIIIPLYNEEDSVSPLYNAIVKSVSSLGLDYEILFVDDGSTDETWHIIDALNQADHGVKGSRLSRNFGHEYALLSGLQACTGSAVISLDADLQHPTELIPRLIEEWQKENKIVKTIRLDPENQSLIKDPRRKLRGIQRINSLQFSKGNPEASYGELESLKASHNRALVFFKGRLFWLFQR